MKRKKGWIRLKGYPHLSKKISQTGKDIKFVTSYCSNVESVASHQFYPLIHRRIIQRKFKKVYDFTDNKEKRAHSFKNEYGIKESTSKTRKVFYASHLDAQILSFYTNKVLSPCYESKLKEIKGLGDCIIAYRKIPIAPKSERNKNNIHLANDVFNEIEKRLKDGKSCISIALDIAEFFDTLNHDLLKKSWAFILGENGKLPPDHYNIYKFLTNFDYINLKDLLKANNIKHVNDLRRKDIQHFYKSRRELREAIRKHRFIHHHPFKNTLTGSKIGIPQGTPISAFLANVYLFDFDKIVHEKMLKIGGYYRRYSDDLVIICDQEHENDIITEVLRIISSDFKLKIQRAKTQINLFKIESGFRKVYFKKPGDTYKEGIRFQYLGFEFDGINRYIRSTSLAKYYRGMKHTIKRIAIGTTRKIKSIKKKGGDISQIKMQLGRLYKTYSHLGKRSKKRNYYLYAEEARNIMKSKTISRQLKNSWGILRTYLEKYRAKYKIPK